jgi:hypothetical protein
MRVGLKPTIYLSQKTTSQRTASSSGSGQQSSYYTSSGLPANNEEGVGIGKTFGKLFKIIGDYWEDMKREIIIGLTITGTATWLFLGSRKGRAIAREIEQKSKNERSWNPFKNKARLKAA